ncbi:chemotaxis protein CheA [Patulibacter brassicae]|uniref:Chemotaxis protein CheA n=1 Tax=Patulibacter brassicae TaxID=1705717 RepID=A0ABU4VM05_9ACTN|nr:chemotaxis protein CheA [Patulibacter brassicae]MDX8152848.1 chemotaxis protein CheA [Patulibacter brassicae]
MDATEYLPMFLAEAREHLQELNLAIVALERGEGDAGATLDEIFRVAHSMKGMSATMGFARTAALTHAMEDVMEPLKGAGGGPVGRRLVDALLACLDAIERTVDEIERDGEEGLDPDPLIAMLRAAAVPGGDAAAGRDATAAADPVAEDAPATASAPSDPAGEPLARGRVLLRVVATLDEQVTMASVRAFMVLSACEDLGTLVRSDPAADALDAFDGDAVAAWIDVDATLDHDVARTSVAAVPEVADVAVWADEPTVAAIAAVPGRDAAEPEPGPGGAIGAGSAGQAPAASASTGPAPTGDEPDVAEAAAPRPAEGGGEPKTRRATSVRVDADRLDQLMHGMGELVVHRTRLEALLDDAGTPDLRDALQDLQRSSHALHHLVMQVRMIPVDAVFLRFPRLVRDLASRLDKQVDLELVGRDTELDRTVVDALGDPLVHLVRNALDHGLETAAEREAAGKPPVGSLTISARQSSGQVVISVSDDGRGIDPERVAARAVQRGLITAAQVAEVDERRAAELLFAPGFSTVEQATDISGRGVGMDAVRTTIRGVGGEVVVHSAKGRGTTTEIRLPLTLAITSALVVDVAGQPYAVPLDRVERIVRVDEQVVRSVVGRPVMLHDGEAIALIDGPSALGEDPAGALPFALILHGHDRSAALTVTRLDGQRELVTRPMPADVSRDAPLAGGAVLAGGEIALVIDVDTLILRGGPAGPAAAADRHARPRRAA